MTQPPQNTVGRFCLRRTIVLVGLMGAGKTSVGRRLARILDVRFVDSDHEIEAAANLRIPEIFEKFGEDYFRDGEERVILRLLEGAPCVLATGGGAFLSEAVHDAVAERGSSVWLRAEPETLYDRVKSKPGRPLLRNKDPLEVLRQLNTHRSPFYAKAGVIVDSPPGINQNEMAARIVSAIIASDAAREPGSRTLQEIGT